MRPPATRRGSPTRAAPADPSRHQRRQSPQHDERCRRSPRRPAARTRPAPPPRGPAPARRPSAGTRPITSRADPAFACAAVSHSSFRRRVTYRRTSVRAMASLISHAWWARNVTLSAICEAASAKLCRRPAGGSAWRCPAPRDHLDEGGDQRGEAHGDEDERRPCERRAPGSGPAGDQREPGGGRRQGTSEIVDHLPETDERDP